MSQTQHRSRMPFWTPRYLLRHPFPRKWPDPDAVSSAWLTFIITGHVSANPPKYEAAFLVDQFNISTNWLGCRSSQKKKREANRNKHTVCERFRPLWWEGCGGAWSIVIWRLELLHVGMFTRRFLFQAMISLAV